MAHMTSNLLLSDRKLTPSYNQKLIFKIAYMYPF